MIDQVQQIAVDQLRSIVTAWGFVGTIVAALTGPAAVQRLKPYFTDSVIGKRNTKRRRLTLGSAAAILTFAVSIWALSQEYTNSGGILLVAILTAVFQITAVEFVFSWMDKRGKDARKFLYTPDQDLTIFKDDDKTTPRD